MVSENVIRAPRRRQRPLRTEQLFCPEFVITPGGFSHVGHRQPLQHRSHWREPQGGVIAVPRHEVNFAAIQIGDDPVPVMLDLVHPAITDRLGPRQLGHNTRWHGRAARA